MSAVERAAEIIATTDVLSVRSWPTLGVTRDSAVTLAMALDAAGLLVTDEAKAVLDAAERHVVDGTAETWIDLDALTLVYIQGRRDASPSSRSPRADSLRPGATTSTTPPGGGGRSGSSAAPARGGARPATTEHRPGCDDDGWDHPGPCVVDEP